MSVVTGITIVCHCVEGEDQFKALNAWFLAHNHNVRLVDLSDRALGAKHPQITLGCVGVNYLVAEDFLAVFKTILWDVPESVVMIMTFEERPAIIYRPEEW